MINKHQDTNGKFVKADDLRVYLKDRVQFTPDGILIAKRENVRTLGEVTSLLDSIGRISKARYRRTELSEFMDNYKFEIKFLHTDAPNVFVGGKSYKCEHGELCMDYEGVQHDTPLEIVGDYPLISARAIMQGGKVVSDSTWWEPEHRYGDIDLWLGAVGYLQDDKFYITESK